MKNKIIPGKIASYCNYNKYLKLFKPFSRPEEVTLFSLPYVYHGDISLQNNFLSSQTNDIICKILNNNWLLQVDKANSKKKMKNVDILYHKVLTFASKRSRSPEELEGFFVIESTSPKYYTKFESVCKFLENNSLNPVFIVSGGSRNE